MKCQVDEIDGGAGEADMVTQGGQAMVVSKAGFVGLVFWILFTEFDIALPVGEKANLSTKAMFLLNLPNHLQVLSDSWSEPLHIQPCHDHSHQEQSHLSSKQNHVLGSNYLGRQRGRERQIGEKGKKEALLQFYSSAHLANIKCDSRLRGKKNLSTKDKI